MTRGGAIVLWPGRLFIEALEYYPENKYAVFNYATFLVNTERPEAARLYAELPVKFDPVNRSASELLKRIPPQKPPERE